MSALFSVLALALLGSPEPARADDASADPWRAFGESCSDLNLPSFRKSFPDFQKFLREGSQWQGAMAQERRRLERLATSTCAKWALNPNGDSALKEFLEQFNSASASAMALRKESIDTLLPGLERGFSEESLELRRWGFSFARLPCGQAFQKMKVHVERENHGIEESYATLRKSCPHAADQIISNALRGETGKGANGRRGQSTAPSRPKAQGASDITGTKPP